MYCTVVLAGAFADIVAAVEAEVERVVSSDIWEPVAGVGAGKQVAVTPVEAFADTVVAAEAGAVVEVGVDKKTALVPAEVQPEQAPEVFPSAAEPQSALLRSAYYFHMSHKILTLQ